MSELIDSLRHDLKTKTEMVSSLEGKVRERDDLIRQNDILTTQNKCFEQKLERFTLEYGKKVEEFRRSNEETNEQIQSLLDEIERIKRDLILEEYRKQEAERKARHAEEKLKNGTALNKKLIAENNSLKNDLKSIQLKYDALQIEMLEICKANSTENSLLPIKQTDEQTFFLSEQSTNDETTELSRSKRKTRDRTESSTSNESQKPIKIARRQSRLITVCFLLFVYRNSNLFSFRTKSTGLDEKLVRSFFFSFFISENQRKNLVI